MNCFSTDNQNCIPIELIMQREFAAWLTSQPEFTRNWLDVMKFRVEPGSVSCIPTSDGSIARVICCIADTQSFWSVGHLPYTLPEGSYTLVNENPHSYFYTACAIAWGLGAYQFIEYKKPQRQAAQLYLPTICADHVLNTVQAIYLVRDCINTPTEDMGPTKFAEVAATLANEFQAHLTQIVDQELLTNNYPAIYTVGRASSDAPRLIDFTWGNPLHPKVTLVGKGVCFDTGGLDIKPSSYMLLMKKDMAGGAHVLGLARMIMTAHLPIRLRVLIPMVENSISGNAYRPGDVIRSRSGKTIEIGNTDAEGRVILADALTEAVLETPNLLIDITTLTGAARVALGTELPAVFCNNDQVVMDFIKEAENVQDPVWRMPLFAAYRDLINSSIADISNNSAEPYAGAITAALFLKEFVPDDIPWMHFDLMAWNLRTRPGRPQGGEAMALRALFQYLKNRFK